MATILEDMKNLVRKSVLEKGKWSFSFDLTSLEENPYVITLAYDKQTDKYVWKDNSFNRYRSRWLEYKDIDDALKRGEQWLMDALMRDCFEMHDAQRGTRMIDTIQKED